MLIHKEWGNLKLLLGVGVRLVWTALVWSGQCFVLRLCNAAVIKLAGSLLKKWADGICFFKSMVYRLNGKLFVVLSTDFVYSLDKLAYANLNLANRDQQAGAENGSLAACYLVVAPSLRSEILLKN